MNKEWTTKEEGYLEELPANTGSGKGTGVFRPDYQPDLHVIHALCFYLCNHYYIIRRGNAPAYLLISIHVFLCFFL